ncbi:hypothetical protein HDU99_004704, partial [Rhizoclosmatium hyalinum]
NLAKEMDLLISVNVGSVAGVTCALVACYKLLRDFQRIDYVSERLMIAAMLLLVSALVVSIFKLLEGIHTVLKMNAVMAEIPLVKGSLHAGKTVSKSENETAFDMA